VLLDHVDKDTALLEGCHGVRREATGRKAFIAACGWTDWFAIRYALIHDCLQ
jgi:hypothetical protein